MMRKDIFGTPYPSKIGRWRPAPDISHPTGEEHFEACQTLDQNIMKWFDNKGKYRWYPMSVYFDYFDFSDRTLYVTPNSQYRNELTEEFVKFLQTILLETLSSWRVYIECGGFYAAKGILIYPEHIRWDRQCGRNLSEAVAIGQMNMEFDRGSPTDC